jgi:hypothetical protein
LVTALAHGDAVRVLFIATEPTPFSARMRAEIEAMGFEIASTDVLDAQGHSTAKAAAYVVEAPPRRVELWLPSPTSGRLELSATVTASAGDDAPDEESQIVRVAEQLRAFFQPLQASASTVPVADTESVPETEPETKPTPDVTPLPPPRERSQTKHSRARSPSSAHGFETIAVAVPIEAASPGIDVLARGGFSLSPRWALGGKLVVPLLSSSVQSGINGASLATALLGPELSLRVVNARALELKATAGLALVWLHTTGMASAPYTSRTDSALTALPSLGAEAGLRLTAGSRLCLAGELGVAVPKLEVVFAGHPVQNWGRPLGLVSLGLSRDW